FCEANALTCLRCLDRAFATALQFVQLRTSRSRHTIRSSADMATSQLQAAHQLRLNLSPESHSRLPRLQADAVAAGYRKPTVGEVLDALVHLSDGLDIATLMATVKVR